MFETAKMFESFFGASGGLGNVGRPGAVGGGCRRCKDRARAELGGPFGLHGLGKALRGGITDASAEISTIMLHSADVDRYSKDHLAPNPIDEEDVCIPRVVEDVRCGRYPSTQNVPIFDYESCPIEADKEIRLLQLLSPDKAKTLKFDQSENLICCKLEPATPANGNYEALSYTWGKKARDIPILILREEGDAGAGRCEISILHATPQLFAALRALQKRDTRYLWIDQLCINQGNDREKAQQIGRMDEIYKGAKQTVIWLGQRDNHTQNVETLLEAFQTEVTAPGSGVNWVRHAMGLEKREALTKLLNREWFSRAWIFQEAVLSKNVKMQCGDIEFSFDTLMRLADAVYEEENSIAGYARSLMKTTVGYNTLDLIKHAKGLCAVQKNCPLAEKLKPGNLFETLVLVLQHLRATEPKDLVNAFLGVVFQNCPNASDKTGYNQPGRLEAITSGTVEEAWTAAARYIIRTTSSLDIFAAASGESGLPSLPSWVPDWSCCFKYASPITPPEFLTSFDASASRTWGKYTDKIEGGELHVRGKIVDTIVWFAPRSIEKYYFMDSGAGTTRRYLKLHDFVKDVRVELRDALSAAENNREKLEHAVLRTLLADGAFGNQSPILEPMHDLVDVYDLENEIEDNDSPGSEDRILLRRLREWGLVAQKKGLFLTSNNVLGLAAHTNTGGAKEGDMIAILQGSKVPCVLRPGHGESKQYRVISQCYLDGWMYKGNNNCYWKESEAKESEAKESEAKESEAKESEADEIVLV